MTRTSNGRPLLGISLADYMQRLQAPAATLDLIGAWWTVSGNGDKAGVPASEFLHSCGYVDGTPDGIIEAWTDSLIGGVSALASRMIADCGAKLLLNAAVAAIEQDGDGGAATRPPMAAASRPGRPLIATGLNPMAGLRLPACLPPAKSRSPSPRPCRARGQGLGQGHGASRPASSRPAAATASNGCSPSAPPAMAPRMLVGFGIEGEGAAAWAQERRRCGSGDRAPGPTPSRASSPKRS